LLLTDTVREEITTMLEDYTTSRVTSVLQALGLSRSQWYHRRVDPSQRKRPGPKPKPIPESIAQAIIEMATANPWYGYRRIAVMCRRADTEVSDRQSYWVMKVNGLLQKRRTRKAEVYQAMKLYELLPKRPDELWQMDVTYVHIPGFGWWYAVTVIDYYSRYLLACHLTNSYCASEATYALGLARRQAERWHGPLAKPPFLVTDNGSSFMAKRFCEFVKDDFSHVRIQYRTPTQLGLLERFHRTLKEEEVYWRLYDSPSHARDGLAEFGDRYNRRRPHWALIPEAGGDPVTPEDVYAHGVAVGIPKWQKWAKAAKAKLDELMTEQAA
jgi:transposase InsO family protein